MNDKQIEIFRICKILAQLLGDDEAIADLKLLYERHREMFKDMEDVREVINKVVKEPEIVVDAARDSNECDIIKAATRLDSRKMGDVVIKKGQETNVIFHANKKKISEFTRLELQVKTGSRDAHFLHPDLKSTWAGSKEHLPANKTITQDSKDSTKDNKNNKKDSKDNKKDFSR